MKTYLYKTVIGIIILGTIHCGQSGINLDHAGSEDQLSTLFNLIDDKNSESPNQTQLQFAVLNEDNQHADILPDEGFVDSDDGSQDATVHDEVEETEFDGDSLSDDKLVDTDDEEPAHDEIEETEIDDDLSDDELVDPDNDTQDASVHDEIEEPKFDGDALSTKRACLSYYEWDMIDNENIDWIQEFEDCDFKTDEDGDGLAKSLDPNDQIKTDWYFVSATLGSDESIRYESNDVVFRFNKLTDRNLEKVLFEKQSLHFGITDRSQALRSLKQCGGTFTTSGICIMQTSISAVTEESLPILSVPESKKVNKKPVKPHLFDSNNNRKVGGSAR